jgi:DNA-binding CsgD family transcriptional regulator
LKPSEWLLDLIYDAATEPELWRSVLTEVADRTNSQGGIIFGISASAEHPANRGGVPTAWFMDGFGLTQAEARVAIAVAMGLNIPEVARQIGLSPNTVKTHLRRVFDKTGTARQAELARLMALLGAIRGN